MPTRRTANNFTASTPVDELGIRYQAARFLKSEGYKALEDLSLLRESELAVFPSLGRLTTTRLREYLKQIGMDFKPEAERHQLRVLNKETHKAIASAGGPVATVRIEDHISALGFPTVTYTYLLEKGVQRISDLARLTARDVALLTGKASAREIVERLRAHGFDLVDKPDNYTLWFHGFYRGKELTFDTSPAAPLRNLAPRIGMDSVNKLKRIGVETVADLQQRHQVTALVGIPGLGKKRVANIIDEMFRLGLIERSAGPLPTIKPAWPPAQNDV